MAKGKPHSPVNATIDFSPYGLKTSTEGGWNMTIQ